MNIPKLPIPFLLAAVTAFILLPRFAWAGDDGATLYKTKCAMCHGVDGAGKPAAKIPSLIGDETKNAPDETLADGIANGGGLKIAGHAFQSKGLAPDQIKMIVSYLRVLQKK